MIRKTDLIQDGACNPYRVVERILRDNKDCYLTKEDIYMRVPRDDDGMPLITISSMENALRCFVRSRCAEVEYIRGVRHFTYGERN